MGKIKSKGAVLVCAVAIILIIVLLVLGGKNDNNNQLADGKNDGKVNNTFIEEFVQVQENGEKVNISEKLKQTKTVEGVELTNISLVEKGGQSEIVANAKNTTSSTIEELKIIITAIDKNENTLDELEASVYELEPGEATILKAVITSDIANAYDFTVRKK